MNTVITPEIQEVMHAIPYRPAVSIILPFEPKMNLHTELGYMLKTATDKVHRQLAESYPADTSRMVMEKLENIIGHLNYNTHKKSIAIYVSPVFEKVLYLDIPVEEKIIVDSSFEIRDLVFSKKQLHKYLVLLLSSKESRMYLGNTNTFVRIVSNTPESAHAYVNDAPERVSNFSDMSERKEILMEKFLHHIDTALDIILNSYRLPLFVLGTKRIAGHFKKITRHQGSVIEYIPGNYEEATPDELRVKLEPYINDWKKIKQKDLLNQLEDAYSKNKLATGMREVWREATNSQGRLLVVEKNYMYAATQGSQEGQITPATHPLNQYSYIKDAVDQVIEKVLENGGDVEFVDPDELINYGHIALVKYY